ncbi:T9SS type A sorting domain-containing protein [Dyadobacter sp. CY345]|uniref:T9SS type A sorting domain-containing protein n=1 Tax=Dyadobacter sp. CY345 TaxID=2909335 RepID=UPI001F3E3A6F|nr:T9SS type A sorting domain-containing protein [Dyadobacter sp. CY345]MCF2443546.1 T9SS type A sorting domain-containing protein [Dyadobacter sp. CY345]
MYKLSTSIVLFLLFALLVTTESRTLAEGTKEISPRSGSISALVLMPDRNTGSYKGSPDDNRIKFNIASTNEKFYYGFNWQEYGSSTAVGTDMYIRIYTPNGTLAAGPIQLPNSGDGYISSYTRAVNGPNLGNMTNGYDAKVFVPTVTGEHYIEIYRSADKGKTQVAAAENNDSRSKSPYFDLTVATSNGEKKPGRVFCKKWGFVAVNSNFGPDANASASPTIYSYSTDETILKVTFEYGFKPIAYDIALNDYGVSNNGNWLEDRKSINSADSPALVGGYKLFLNSPERSLYPVTPITSSAQFASVPVTGCGGGFALHFVMPAAGDARLLLDVNGKAGFDEGTTDRIIEVPNAKAGDNTIAWDGKDGLGNIVKSGTAMSISAVYQRGRFNIPIYDAEINANGFNIETIAPISLPNNKLYWDDSALKNVGTGNCNTNNAQNNYTGAGLNRTLLGSLSPTHAWNGDGNLKLTLPAPSVGGNDDNGFQCDDFGNVRVINSWGWALQSSSSATTLTFGCFSLSGNVFHDADGLKNNLVNHTEAGTGTNVSGVLNAILVGMDGKVVASVPVDADGKYSFNNIIGYTFDVILSTTPGVVGQDAPAAQLPTGWMNTGEQAGEITGTGIDAVTDGKIRITVTGNTTDINFGIEQPPVADPKTYVAPSSAFTSNPNGYPAISGFMAVAATSLDGGYPNKGSLSGSDAEDCAKAGSCNNAKTFVIESVNANTRVYYNFGSGPVELTAGTIIPDFDVTKIVIYGQSGSGTNGDPFGFTYALTDAAGVKSAPATYSITTNTPLPVTLISFETQKIEQKAVINWITSEETNSDYFEVQRSTNGKSWYGIGKVEAAGESKISHTYNYTDKQPKTGENLYRLKMVDRDGTFAYSRINSLNFEFGFETSIYPNPVSDQLHLKATDWAQVKSITIFDLNGASVYTSGATPSDVIDVKNLNPGMYVIRILQTDGLAATHKMVRLK